MSTEKPRREWWVKKMTIDYSVLESLPYQEGYAHVLELRPGEIVISRDEFRDAIDYARENYTINEWMLESKLFGEVE